MILFHKGEPLVFYNKGKTPLKKVLEMLETIFGIPKELSEGREILKVFDIDKKNNLIMYEYKVLKETLTIRDFTLSERVFLRKNIGSGVFKNLDK